MARIVRYSLSIGLIVLLLTRVDLNAFWTTLKEVEMMWFGVGLLVMGFNVLIRAYKWQLFLRVQGATLPFGTAQRVFYMSMFFNNFFLGSLGGDAFRIYRALDYSASKAGAAMSVILDRITGLMMAMALIVGLGIWLFVVSENLVFVGQLAAVVLVGAIVGLVVLAIFMLRPELLQLGVLRRVPKLEQFMGEMLEGVRAYKRSPKTVVLSLFISLLDHVVNTVTVYCLALAAHANVAFVPLIFVTRLVALLVMVPVSVNGIGVKEASYVFYLEQVGVVGPAALLVAVLSRAATLVFSAVGGLLFLVDGSSRKAAVNWASGSWR